MITKVYPKLPEKNQLPDSVGIASVVVVVFVVFVSVSVIYFYSVVLLVGIGCSSEPALLLGHLTLLDCVLPPGC